MKTTLLVMLCLVFFSALSQPVRAQSHAEEIKDFQSTIHVLKDGSIKVSEMIRYDFSDLKRHGIFRTIPLIKKNKEGKQFKIGITVERVKNDRNMPYQFTVTSSTNDILVKIGNAQETLTGEHTYIIEYSVRGALSYFSDHDELYWNVTGDKWEVPILNAGAKVILPMSDNTPQDLIKQSCFVGIKGSVDSECSLTLDGNELAYGTKTSLQPHEGITIVAAFPKKVVAVMEPQEVMHVSNTTLGIVFFLIGAVGLFWYILLPLWMPFKWWRNGRDPVRGKEIAAHYDAPKLDSGAMLTPAETGTLVDERVEDREVSATIVSLAQKGYLKIHEKGRERYDLIRTTKMIDIHDLRDYESKFINDLFNKKNVFDLENDRMVNEVKEFKNAVYAKLLSEKLFPQNPETVRAKYKVLMIFALLTFNFFLMVAVGIFGRIMPKKTLAGANAAAQARSLLKFLKTQDRQLAFQAKELYLFEKLLPYAVAFGVEKIWAERFKDLAFNRPNWFEGQSGSVFNTVVLAQSLAHTTGSITASMTPVTSSSGFSSGFSGGSSGGGGGGGGGGSW